MEDGNTMPDITLLAPIARLMDVSLEELLCFQQELTAEEIQQRIQELERKLLEQPYDSVFSWAKEQIKQYPNCEILIYSFAVELDGRRMMQKIPQNEEQDALYGYYLCKAQYEKAEEDLSFFSLQNPERKRKQAVLYEKSGKLQKACQAYEEILMANYQISYSVLNSLLTMQL